MKAAFKHFINDIKHGENVDIYVTLSLSLVLAILGLTGIIQATILSAGILATLSVLAFNMLAFRRTLSDFSQVMASLQRVTDIVFEDRNVLLPFRIRMEGVSTIWLLGSSLVNIIPPDHDVFLEKMQNGGEVRLIILNPKSPYLSAIAEQLTVSSEILKGDIDRTLHFCKGFVREGLGAGKFEIRQIEMTAGFSMVISNPTKPNGQIVVEFPGYHTSSLNQRPHLRIDKSKNQLWFDYYLKQYDELWDSAIPCKLDEIII